MSELSKIVEELTPGPYRWAIIPEGSEQMKTIVGHFEKGSGDVHMVYLPEHPGTVVGDDPDRPEHGVILCMAGNGPNSKNNALALVELLTHAPTLLAAAEEGERLRDALSWVALLDHAKAGLESWSRRPHNKRWWKRIDGTPIPNDLLIDVCKSIAAALTESEAEDGA